MNIAIVAGVMSDLTNMDNMSLIIQHYYASSGAHLKKSTTAA
ncbi:hypothetical protein SAMN04487905_10981 [Actinopolyspora xinjiangensis]|uniref:Uncharacterized protein n=1 Tax=Actinopolyspora xinjiangensis TaxID=405564 RepID=A0A1H0VMU9_9ACTN|nr:hypothetical protein SAMN04487905_10981 [Actinopolyspora xinjiangensis]